MKSTPQSIILAANATVIAEGKLEAIPEFFAPDYIAHLTGQTMAGGHKAIRQVITAILHSFPQLQCDVEIMVEDKNRIAWQRTLTGIQKAAFKGFPSRGKTIVWRDMVTSRISDGLIAEEWIVTDLAERLLLAQKDKARAPASSR